MFVDVFVIVFADKHKDKILYQVSLQINQGWCNQYMLNIEEECSSLELDLEVSFCLSSFYKDFERDLFPRKLLTKEQKNALNVVSAKEVV